jgi:hypothetical protein
MNVVSEWKRYFPVSHRRVKRLRPVFSYRRARRPRTSGPQWADLCFSYRRVRRPRTSGPQWAGMHASDEPSYALPRLCESRIVPSSTHPYLDRIHHQRMEANGSGTVKGFGQCQGCMGENLKGMRRSKSRLRRPSSMMQSLHAPLELTQSRSSSCVAFASLPDPSTDL